VSTRGSQLLTFISNFFFSSCGSKSGKRVKEKVETQQSDTDTLLFSPEKIGVTKLDKEFIPYPNYDGGTGIRVSFSFGIQYKGKTYEVDVQGSKFFGENISEEKAKNDHGLSGIIESHYLLSNTPKDYIDVLIANGEVIKLTRRGGFILNDEFHPTKLIWKK
jgi:hypothetical protein